MKTKLFLLDDHCATLDGLRLVLGNEPDLKVVGEAKDGRIALKKIFKLKPDIAIVDIELPGISGTIVAREITKKSNIKVIALSAHDSIKYIQQMLLAGAAGYVLKTSDTSELIRAIRKVMKGREFIDEGLTHLVVQDYRKTLRKTGEVVHLTVSEREILQLISQGKSRYDIAKYFGVVPHTVSRHRQNIIDKTGASTTADLVKYAIENGLT